MAQKIGILGSSLGDIELGKKRPSVQTLKKLCEFYGVSMEEIMDN
ncbi:helix-turn-helix domain-containing protein [Alicyclobacillus acidoterrestris]